MAWEVGQTVEVQSRTWAGINKPGGCAKITEIRYAGTNILGLDVKYIVGGGTEKNISPGIVSPFEELKRGGRNRRGRNFLMDRVEDVKRKVTASLTTKSPKKKKKPKRHKQPSPQPTSPSTPATPEPKQRPSQKPTKVTPIPSYVNISDVTLEVSPLDRTNLEEQKPKKPVARRGLFETTKPAAAISKPKEHLKSAPASTNAISSINQKKAKQKAASKPKVAKQQVVVYPTPRTNVASRQPAPQKKSVNLTMPRPGPAAAQASGKSVPLQRVFENEVQKARDFIGDVMGAKSRYDEFLSTFQTIRKRLDDEMIEEAEFRSLVSSDSIKFTENEINEFLDKLEKQGKVMRSNGTIIII